MKKIFFTFLLALMAMTVAAIPAKRGVTQVLTLADGTTVSAQLVGDEFGHYWLGTDGNAYQKVAGSTVFQSVDAEQIQQKANARRSEVNQQRMRKMAAKKKLGTFGDYTGQKKALVILVNFNNSTTFQTGHNKALYENIANTPGYNLNGFSGSMYDYFFDQSNGQFQLTFDIAGPVTVSQNAAYYGGNDWSGNDNHPAQMACEAVQLADSQVDFSQYDWDNDGYVDQVYIIYAGRGEANGGGSDTIWPHAWSLSSGAAYGDGSGAQLCDGVYVDTYACGAELQGYSQISGIGTMCHEFSHCLGYPDFYDTDYSGGVGMDDWDVMCGGSYNGNEFVPAGYTSYERWMAGWLEPIELTTTKTITDMAGLQEGGNAYIIYNDAYPDEYFMLENRKNIKWDTYLPGEGLLIVHVDYDASIWANNKPNDVPSHQRMTWVPANNYQSNAAGGAYPYNSNNAFNSSSTPRPQFYNNTLNGTKYPEWGVEGITKNSSDKHISFNFVGLTAIETPVFTPEPGTYSEPQEITISCETEDVTIYYTIDGSDPETNGIQYTGPFTLDETATVKAIAVNEEDQSLVGEARYVIHIPGQGTTFTKVYKNANLKPGRKFIVVYEDGSKVLNGFYEGTTPYGLAENVDLNAETHEAEVYANEATVMTLGGNVDGWTFQLDDDSYLSWTSGNTLNTSADEYGWTISVSEEGAVVKTGTRKLQFNSSAPRFACYSSTQKKAYLYVEKSDELLTEKDEVLMAFSRDNVSVELGMDVNEPTLVSTPATLDVTYTSSNPEVAEVDATTGVVTPLSIGETFITATFDGNDDYFAGSAFYKLTVTEPVVGTGRFQLVTSMDDMVSGKKYLIVSTKEDGSYVAWNGLGDNAGTVGSVTIGDDEIIDLSVIGNKAQPVVFDYDDSSSQAFWSIKEGERYIKAVSTSKLGGATNTDGVAARWTVSIGSSTNEASIKNRNNNNYMKYNRSADMFRVYGASSQTAIYLYKEIEVPAVTEVAVTIGQHGAASFSSEYPLDFTNSDVSAYIVTGKNGNSFKKQQVTVVPANTGLVVEAAQGEYFIPVVAEEDAADIETIEGNLLVATSTGEFTVGEYYGRVYGLFYSTSKKKVSFQKKKADYTFGVNKSYLLLPEGIVGAPEISFNDEGETTGITKIETGTQNEQGEAYNLNGQKVNGAYKGVVIINGKKVIKK